MRYINQETGEIGSFEIEPNRNWKLIFDDLPDDIHLDEFYHPAENPGAKSFYYKNESEIFKITCRTDIRNAAVFVAGPEDTGIKPAMPVKKNTDSWLGGNTATERAKSFRKLIEK